MLRGSAALPVPVFTGTLPWIERAECSKQGVDTKAFFPKRREFEEYAIRICSRCPVIADCYEFAKDNGEKHGVWGGVNLSGLAGRPSRNTDRFVII